MPGCSARLQGPFSAASIQTFRIMLLSLEFEACTHRGTISDFWGHADRMSGMS
jgi:hypothetical protein